MLKHLTLCTLLSALNRKPAPWSYLETHAGAGGYDLADEAAQRTGEWRDGIGRLWGGEKAPPLVQEYLHQVAAFNPDGQLRRYPGSPLFVSRFARADDRMILCERVPQIAARLRENLGRDARVVIHQRDGYEAPALLPPAQKRGLVLVDPPFERPDEFDAVCDLLAASLGRFAHGVFAVWYARKNARAAERFLRRAAVGRERLVIELDTGAPREGQMPACGMLVVNPPFAVDEQLRPAVEFLAGALAQGRGAASRVERLS